MSLLLNTNMFLLESDPILQVKWNNAKTSENNMVNKMDNKWLILRWLRKLINS